MQYQLKILEVELKEQFVTSHSKTNRRKNAYLQCQYFGVVGQSEVGLPPKNNITYFSDFDDIKNFFDQFIQTQSIIIDAFQKQEKYLKIENNNQYTSILNLELSKLDQIEDNKVNQPAKALIECALIDWYSKITDIPISKLVSIENDERLRKFEVRNFFTISIADFDQTQQQILSVLKTTNNLKIKVNDNLDYIFQLLTYLNDLVENQLIGSLVFDCNCAWTPDIALKFLHKIQKYKKVLQYVYMIEQPFPVGIISDEWIQVKEQYNQYGLKIFADESVSNLDDVIRLKDYVNGINIKIEKSGGYRGALRILELAEKLNLQKWIGVMVGTSLNSNQAINLFGLVDFGGDADGNYLVTEQSEIVQPSYKFGQQQNFGKICL